MEKCPSCGKVMVYANHVCTGGMPIIQTVPTFTPNEFVCPRCDKTYPMNSTHACRGDVPVITIERPVDMDTENEMRITALQQAVILTGQGNRDTVAVAESFFKFLMGESQ